MNLPTWRIVTIFLRIVRYIYESEFKDVVQFCHALKTTTKALDVFNAVDAFFTVNHGILLVSFSLMAL